MPLGIQAVHIETIDFLQRAVVGAPLLEGRFQCGHFIFAVGADQVADDAVAFRIIQVRDAGIGGERTG